MRKPEQCAEGSRSTANAHIAVRQVTMTPTVEQGGLPSHSLSRFLERDYYDTMVYPTVYHRYLKLHTMPASDTESITNITRADILAFVQR
jgi:hypothetical protein